MMAKAPGGRTTRSVDGWVVRLDGGARIAIAAGVEGVAGHGGLPRAQECR